ncbi:type I restriction-modification system subunit M [Paenibacillus hunanensis]|uniref:site-specific DNA-methyltransferase (adenine-specific) n=1 Tax=Paenibacillus hunanensis TaxID=539262 RepID=A0ABU1J388_9BACL|nr:class I SAM-dependent DNA methyltransferase [Paenibacillus hunanensis]MDR6244943.1 type I restriction enzyme M protein [Paenibacillus hunanensis]GGJ05300.1 DNA methyltransferase [Paenibacillus hunanensis]
MKNFQEKVSFIWTIAEILRGPYKKEEYGKVALPMAVLRRFDCVLADTKVEVLAQHEKFKHLPQESRDEILNRVAKQNFSNVSKYDFSKLLNDSDNIADNLRDYINGFSKSARDIIEYFDFDKQIEKMDRNNLLYLVVKRFSEIDLHPDTVSNMEMGYIFEELIRRFSEDGEAGDHYTPREVIRLMVSLLFNEDNEILTKPGITQTLYDSCVGTGGMGSVAQEYLRELNPTAHFEFFGQEINEESYAICKADILIKGEEAKNIVFGNTLSNDAFPNKTFDYMITNPPYGVEWKPAEQVVKDEHENKGYNGRFGAGLPRISDGQLLFLQHLVSKMKRVTPENPKGSRIAIIMNGSPLFTGDAGSGESEIRRYMIENDLVEAIVAMPDQLFYNTGISTYIWILANNKDPLRKGKIQLVNGASFYKKMRKSLGNKRHELAPEHIEEIVRIYGNLKGNEHCKIFDNEDFGYRKITVERPLRLNFQISEERVNELANQTVFSNLATSKKKGQAGLDEIEAGKKLQQQIIDAVFALQDSKIYKNREDFTKKIKKAFKDQDLTIPAPLLKAILAALSEKDETADICRDSKGNPEPDSDLRDTENVPLKEDIHEYFEQEVKPHVPDAWIDESKTKIGYEIPFTRYFYQYAALRSSGEILSEIKELEASILDKLKKVLG